MIVHEHTVEIDRPVAEVFAYVADPATSRTGTTTSDRSNGPGMAHCTKARRSPGTSNSRLSRTTEPPRVLVWPAFGGGE